MVTNEGSGQKCFNINKNIVFIDENLTKPRLKIHKDNAMSNFFFFQMTSLEKKVFFFLMYYSRN
jgi:hypothetical protein